MRTSGLPLQESAFLFQEREEERWARGKMEEEGEEGKVGVEGKEKGKGRRGRKGEEGRAEWGSVGSLLFPRIAQITYNHNSLGGTWSHDDVIT